MDYILYKKRRGNETKLNMKRMNSFTDVLTPDKLDRIYLTKSLSDFGMGFIHLKYLEPIDVLV